ncbi:MAG: hypothetical protein LWW81_13745 [Rhodocyclales bacterium]|nr:hypothetical protein [Rhodocyclales bacterium]
MQGSYACKGFSTPITQINADFHEHGKRRVTQWEASISSLITPNRKMPHFYGRPQKWGIFPNTPEKALSNLRSSAQSASKTPIAKRTPSSPVTKNPHARSTAIPT